MFKFKLEPLLQHRRHLEESCRKELASSRQVLSAERRKLAVIKQKNAECLARIRESQKHRHTPADIVPLYRYQDTIAAALKNQRDRVSLCKKEVAAKFQMLIAAVKKRKTLEKLKDRRKAAYLKHLQRAEENFMNEVACQRHHLNK